MHRRFGRGWSTASHCSLIFYHVRYRGGGSAEAESGNALLFPLKNLLRLTIRSLKGSSVHPCAYLDPTTPFE